MQVASPAHSTLGCEAVDLLAALDAYESAATGLVESWLDMEAYALFGRQVHLIRDHGVSTPALTVLTLQLAIAHSELVSALWQNASVGVPRVKLLEVRERHRLAVHELRIAAARLPKHGEGAYQR